MRFCFLVSLLSTLPAYATNTTNCQLHSEDTEKYFCVGEVGLMLPLNPVRPYYKVKQPKGKEGVCGLSHIGDCNGYLTPRNPETAITHENLHA